MIPAVSAAPGQGAAAYQWVAVGNSGALYTSTSTTASSWTSQTSSFSTTNINAVASNGAGLYVAVGSSGKLATSSDGTNWTQRTSAHGTSRIDSVAYGNGYWVTTCNADIGYSTDGITWTLKSSIMPASIASVSYGNGLWVAVSASSSYCYTATDPTSTWTSRTIPISNASSQGVTYFKGISLWTVGIQGGGGGTNCMASSTDGLTWTARSLPFAYESVSKGVVACNSTVAVTGATKTVVGPSYDIASSTNGTTWTDRTPAFTDTPCNVGASDNANLIVLGGPRLQSSTDGITWTDRGTIAAGMTMNGLCHSSGVPSIR